MFACPQELDHNVPTQQRVRAMKELHDLVATKRLEEVTTSSVVASAPSPPPTLVIRTKAVV